MADAGTYSFRFKADITDFAGKVGGMVATLRDKIGSGLGMMLKNQLLQYFSFMGIINQYKQLISYADRYYDLSKRLQVSSDFLQKLGYAMEQTGGDLGSVTQAFRELKTAMGAPNAKDNQAFQEFGITLEDIKSGNYAAVFEKILLNASKLAAEGRNIQPLMQAIFGRASMSLMGVVVENFAQLSDEAQRFGIVINETTLKQLADVDDKMNQMRGTWRGLLADTIPALTKVLEFLQTAVAVVKIGGIVGGTISANVPSKKRLLTMALVGPGPYLAASVLGHEGTLGSKKAKEDYDSMMKQIMEVIMGLVKIPTPETMPAPGGSPGGIPLSEKMTMPSAFNITPSADSYARMGLFLTPGIAGMQSTILNVMKEQLQEFKRARRLLEDLNKSAKENTLT